MNSEQLCWTCQNAVPNAGGTRGCAWSIRFEPIPGWDASPVERNTYGPAGNTGMGHGYEIRSCPQYLADGREEPKKSPWQVCTLCYQGKTLTLQQWSEETGISIDSIRYRDKANWPAEKILTSTLQSGGIPVIGTNLATGERRFWRSMSKAAKEGGFRLSRIRACCQGTQKSHKGWRFTRTEEEREVL